MWNLSLEVSLQQLQSACDVTRVALYQSDKHQLNKIILRTICVSITLGDYSDETPPLTCSGPLLLIFQETIEIYSA